MNLPSPVLTTRPPSGLRLIIGYKIAKAAVELLAGIAIFALGSAGATRDLVHVALLLRHHATEAWSIALAEKLLDVSTARHVMVVAVASVADGIVTAVEGWALYRGYAWSHWLVMLTTASLLPFEIIALARHFNIGRVLLLTVNLLIVVYLLRHLTASRRP
jgi:uncharacterized membrane protein (DUF2068 family)